MPPQPSYPESGGSDQAFFELLIDQHYAALYRFAMSLTRSDPDARDLVQETFLTWAEKGGQLRDLSRAKAWLFTTLHRRFLEKQRRIVRFPEQDVDTISQDLPPIEPLGAAEVDARALAGLLDKMDPQFRAAVALFYLEDYSYPEIAGILAIPLGTVKSRIARGLLQLRQLALGSCKSGARPGGSAS